MDAEPFTVAFDTDAIEDLKQRLRRTRWSARRDGQGIDRDALERLCARWADGFDFAACQDRLNRHPQFTAQVGPSRMHFVHARSDRADARPLLLLNGWPASYAELLPMVEPLTAPEDGQPAFHVVIPSLPGFGFSEPRPDGWSAIDIAAQMAELMTGLGYDRFGAHGSDVGAGAVLGLGLKHQDRMTGIHMCNVYWAYPPPDDATPEEKEWLGVGQGWFMTDGGYAHIQGTRPITQAVGLTDSPAGLAAWILEKFDAWSDGGLAAFDEDDLLTNLTLYWMTGSIASSFLPYEGQTGEPDPVARRNETPAGVIVFPKDILPAPRVWGERWLNLQHWTEAPRGGHFGSLEAPDLLADDLRAFFAGRS